MKHFRSIYTFAICLGLSFCLMNCGGGSEPEEPQSSGPQLDASVVANLNLRELQQVIHERNGKPLLIKVWATTCPICIQEMPMVNELYEKYGEKVDFLALSSDGFNHLESAVPGVMKRHNMKMPVRIWTAEDPRDAILAMDSEWPGSLPATFIFDKEGNKIAKLIGEQTKDAFTSAIEKAMNS
ncbi:redoxin family protein [bacterium]|nr:redoxin family protein [bacterium]